MTRSKHPFAYPAPGSLMSSEAAKWYLESVRAIAGTLGRDDEPMEMLEAAWAIKARLRLAAALSLVDPELIEEFLRAMALPSIDTLLANAGAPAGDDAPRKALARVLTITELERRAFPGTVGEAIGMEVTTGDETQVMTERGWKPKQYGGFTGGWKVKTPEGSKRLDEIALGDLVMSAPATDSGPAQPKRVVKIHRREGHTIRFLAGEKPEGGLGFIPVMVADSTMIWIDDRGWTRVDEIKDNMKVRYFEGSAEIFRNYRIFRTTRENVGWIQQGHDFRDTHGSLFDVVKHETVETPGKMSYLEPEVHDSDERFLRTTVIDLEVEDFHTYYVNEFWAHGA